MLIIKRFSVKDRSVKLDTSSSPAANWDVYADASSSRAKPADAPPSASMSNLPGYQILVTLWRVVYSVTEAVI